MVLVVRTVAIGILAGGLLYLSVAFAEISVRLAEFGTALPIMLGPGRTSAVLAAGAVSVVALGLATLVVLGSRWWGLAAATAAGLIVLGVVSLVLFSEPTLVSYRASGDLTVSMLGHAGGSSLATYVSAAAFAGVAISRAFAQRGAKIVQLSDSSQKGGVPSEDS